MEAGGVQRQRIGYWFSEKKSKKFNLEEFHQICDRAGFDLVKVCEWLAKEFSATS